MIKDQQKAFIAWVLARMAFLAHRMHGQTPITEAAQLEIECLSPGHQPCHPQQHTESTGRGLSSLECVCWEAPGIRGSGLGQGRLSTPGGSKFDLAARAWEQVGRR